MNFFLKGVDFRSPVLTRKPRIWWAYICWCIQYQMDTHKPYYPGFIRSWALKRYGSKRYHMQWRMVHFWQANLKDFQLTDDLRPLPWWLGEAALGVFVKPWDWLARQFRKQTLGLSHRCEFTDKLHGALYTDHADDFMQQAFERFIERISPDGVEPDEDSP